MWMAMGAIVSTPRLGQEKAKTLATAAITRPRSMKGGRAEGVMSVAATLAIAVTASPCSMEAEESEVVVAAAAITDVVVAPLVMAESIASKRE